MDNPETGMPFPRLEVNLHPDTAALLAEIVERRECSVTEAIRQCIVTTALIHDEWREGSTITVRKADGRVHEVLDLCPPQTPEAKERDS